MNKLIVALSIVSLASLVGCASTGINPMQVEAEYKVDASKSPVAQFVDEAPVALSWTMTVADTQSVPSTDHPTLGTDASRNRGACRWQLLATGEDFDSKGSALKAAESQKLTDRRVGEHCFKGFKPSSTQRAITAAMPLAQPLSVAQASNPAPTARQSVGFDSK